MALKARKSRYVLAYFAMSALLCVGVGAALYLAAADRPPRWIPGTVANADWVDVNAASLAELQSLPGIGPVLSDRIMAGRPYAAPEDLLAVQGIGSARLDAIRGRIRFGPHAAPEAPPTAPATLPPGWSHVYAGLPDAAGYPHEIMVLRNQGYKSGYCVECRVPAWVAYRVFAVEDAESPPRPSRFRADPRVPNPVTHDDYTHSGFDRGHMAPNYAIATRYGREAQVETFLMTNIAPQTPALNRRVWERIERLIAREYANHFEEVWVKVGPIYGDAPARLASGVPIPEAFYKVIIDEDAGAPRALAFIVPQDVSGDEPPEQFLTTINDIERATGLDFFHELDDALETILESTRPQTLW